MPATLTAALNLAAPSPARRALHASGAAWLVALASALWLVPPLLQHTLQSAWRTALLGTVLVVAWLLHGFWLALGAARLRRSVAGWMALGLLLFPLGGATALVLLNWLADEPGQRPAPAPPAG